MNIGALLAGLFSGIIGGMGLGGGAVLIIYLSVFKNTEQLKAQGINLLFFIPIATLAVVIYAFKKQIKWKITLPLAIGGIVGAVIGFFLTGFMGGNFTSKLFGGFLLFLGIKELFLNQEPISDDVLFEFNNLGLRQDIDADAIKRISTAINNSTVSTS